MTTETEVQALRRELEELKRTMDAGQAGGDASIALARREIEAQYFRPTPSIMDAPCQHVYPDGTMCGSSWKLDNDTIRPLHMPLAIGGHSYRPKPLEVPEEQAGPMYRLSKTDRALYGVEEPAPKQATEIYLSEKQAAGQLGVTVKALRGMVKAETVQADRIGDVTLVRRASVERILAMTEAIREAGTEEAESDG